MVIFFDTETTGLCPGNICELSYIMQDGDNIKGKNFFFAVDYVEYGALCVHGFSVEKLEQLSGGKDFSCFIDEIEKDFSAADLIVSHNTAFDIMFMRKEFERSERDFTYKDSFCSMKKMTPICKIPRANGVGYKYPKLSELCSFFSVTEADVKKTCIKIFGADCGFHDARYDTAALFLSVNRGVESEKAMECIKGAI